MPGRPGSRRCSMAQADQRGEGQAALQRCATMRTPGSALTTIGSNSRFLYRVTAAPQGGVGPFIRCQEPGCSWSLWLICGRLLSFFKNVGLCRAGISPLAQAGRSSQQEQKAPCSESYKSLKQLNMRCLKDVQCSGVVRIACFLAGTDQV